MKHILPIVAVVVLCYATAIQSAEEKINIVNEIGIATPITVTLTQANNPKKQKPVKIIKSSDKLFYNPTTNDMVTITYKIKDESFTQEFQPTALNDKELRITALKDILPMDKKWTAPKKQPTKVTISRPEEKETIKNYSLVIKDSLDTPITASSTFKANTDYVLKKPFLRLNKHESQKPFWIRYNSNKIILTGNYINGTNSVLGMVTVTAKDVPEGFRLVFWGNRADIVNPKDNTILKSLKFEQ